MKLPNASNNLRATCLEFQNVLKYTSVSQGESPSNSKERDLGDCDKASVKKPQTDKH